MSKFIITLTGPSCSGKTTIENNIIKMGLAKRLCGYTTREKRVDEIDGVDVNFVPYEEGVRLHNSSNTIQKLHYNGHYYGKTEEELNRLFATDDAVICIIEPSGLSQLESYADKHEHVRLISYFVTASTTELTKRMLTRFKNQPDPDVDYYAKRVRSLIQNEIHWGNAYNAFRETLLNDFKEDVQLNTDIIASDINALRCAQL